MKDAAAMDKDLMFVWGYIKTSTRTGVSVKLSESKNWKDGCVAECQCYPQGQQMHIIENRFTDGYVLLRHNNIWGKGEGIRWAWIEFNMLMDLIGLVELGWEPPWKGAGTIGEEALPVKAHHTTSVGQAWHPGVVLKANLGSQLAGQGYNHIWWGQSWSDTIQWFLDRFKVRLRSPSVDEGLNQ